MSTTSNQSKVASIMDIVGIPNSTKKIKYLWQNINDIREVRGKIHSCKEICSAGQGLQYGDKKVFTIPTKKFISRPVLKLQITGTTSVVTPDLWGLACIEKVEITHNSKIIEYNGEDLAHIIFHYCNRDELKALYYSQMGGNGATLSAIVFTAYIPIYTGFEHPSQLSNGKFIEPYYTGLLNSTLDIAITFKTAANSLKTPDTITSFTTCELYYQSYWAEQLEMSTLTTSYERFIYDIKYFRSKKTFVSGVEQSIDISSLCNDNVQVHDIIFQLISDTNWTTNKYYNQGSAPTNFILNVDSSDWYKSSNNNAGITDYNWDYELKYTRKSSFAGSTTSYYYLVDPFLHEISDNYSSTLDETIITPAVKMNQKVPTLKIIFATGADYWLICTCLRRKLLQYNGNFITEKMQ